MGYSFDLDDVAFLRSRHGEKALDTVDGVASASVNLLTPTTICSRDCAAQSGIEDSSDAMPRRWWISALTDEMTAAMHQDIAALGIEPPTHEPRATDYVGQMLDLIGKLEGWGIGPATPVAEVSIKVSAATGAQLKELLKKLPDGMTFELSLEKEDN